MLSYAEAYPLAWIALMDNRDRLAGHIGKEADGVAFGKDINQQNVDLHFDREWVDDRRTMAERLRDLEELVYGDARSLRIGILQQQRWFTMWLVTLSIIQSLTLLLVVAVLWKLAHM